MTASAPSLSKPLIDAEIQQLPVALDDHRLIAVREQKLRVDTNSRHLRRLVLDSFNR